MLLGPQAYAFLLLLITLHIDASKSNTFHSTATTTTTDNKGDAQSGNCVDWPPEGAGKLLMVGNASASLCTASDLLMDTWATVSNDIMTVDVEPPGTSDVDCADYYPPAQIVSFLRLSVFFSPADYASMRNCLPTSPYILFRGPPMGGPISSDLTSKDGLDKLIKQYDPCDDVNDDCIIPETFHISDDLEECQQFFSLLRGNHPEFAQRKWLIKPKVGHGGEGFRMVYDVQTELVDPYGDCNDQVGPPVFVQRYVMPYLLDDHACYMRTYFLFKFRDEPGHDPAQAWRVDAGNVHVCTEPYSLTDDLKPSALTRNKPWWLNPRASSGTTQFDIGLWALILRNVAQLFNRLAIIFDQYASETTTYSGPNEAAWTVATVDMLIDKDLRLWLMDLNPCHKKPWYHDANNFHAEWNPYISIFRIVLSHYRRYFLDDNAIHEGDCSTITFSTTVQPVYPLLLPGS